jgi:hypothetical protein
LNLKCLTRWRDSARAAILTWKAQHLKNSMVTASLSIRYRVKEVIYEVWSKESGNCLGVFMAEDEALELVREVAGAYGDREAARDLSVSVEDAAGKELAVMAGDDLIRLATRRRQLAV